MARGRDSNPRDAVNVYAIHQSRSFDHSDTSPRKQEFTEKPIPVGWAPPSSGMGAPTSSGMGAPTSVG